MREDFYQVSSVRLVVEEMQRPFYIPSATQAHLSIQYPRDHGARVRTKSHGRQEHECRHIRRCPRSQDVDQASVPTESFHFWEAPESSPYLPCVEHGADMMLYRAQANSSALRFLLAIRRCHTPFPLFGA